MATETVMEHDVDKHEDSNAWSGAKSPFKASYGKLMMWYFLLSDAFTFAGFLIAYGAIRFSSPTWPVPDFVFSTAPFGVHDAPLIFVTIMSFLLIISSAWSHSYFPISPFIFANSLNLLQSKLPLNILFVSSFSFFYFYPPILLQHLLILHTPCLSSHLLLPL